jgi:hypothetical protein
MRLAIQKLGYSRNPWRLVDLDSPADYNGPQQVCVTARFDHPTLGPTVIDEAVSGATQRECVEVALGLLGRMIELKQQEVEASRRPSATVYVVD